MDATELQREVERLQTRNQEIDDIFLSLYTDKAKGIPSEQRFVKLTAAIEQEQEANRRRLQGLAEMMRHSDEQESDMRSFISEIRQYATITELDEAVLHRLISKILIFHILSPHTRFFLYPQSQYGPPPASVYSRTKSVAPPASLMV